MRRENKFMDAKEAIDQCARHPEHLHDLSPSVFEAVVAELLASFGWGVSLTPASRDGGYDILGVTTDRSGLQTSWVVECKRYSPQNKVGVELARQLVGVKHHIGVPNAVLVTTSGFTAGARDVSSARQDLQLVGLEELSEWLKEYAPPKEATHTASRSFSSCFVSHSSKDEEFAQRLTARLRQAGVRVWYAPEDIAPGDKIYDQVKKAIATFDRLLVVLSRHSMSSPWVQTELASAIARERREGTRVLFPVSLVGIDEIKQWECLDSDTGVDIAKELRAYHIPDFSNSLDRDSFEKQVKRIVDALRDQEASPRGKSASRAMAAMIDALSDKITLASEYLRDSSWNTNFPEGDLGSTDFEKITVRYGDLVDDNEKIRTLLRASLHYGRDIGFWLSRNQPTTRMTLEAILATITQAYRRPAYRALTVIEWMRTDEIVRRCREWAAGRALDARTNRMLEAALDGVLRQFFDAGFRGDEPTNADLAVETYDETIRDLERPHIPRT